jgi:hypothetical protein
MKNLKFKPLLIVLFAFGAITFTSCSKDDDPAPYVFPSENPLSGFLSDSGFDEVETENVDQLSNRELGYRFRPTATGAIIALAARIPAVNSNLRVTIWDAESQEVLKTELFNITSSGIAVTKSIAPVPLVKDHEYMVTMNTNDWYDYRRTDDGSASYPVTEANIQVIGFGYAIGTGQTFPNFTATNYVNGDVSFTFQRTQ